MPDDQSLNLERIMDLVADASAASLWGIAPDVAAAEIVKVRRPTLRELAAARRENQEVNGAGTPEILRTILPPSPVPEEVVRLRRMIDEVLVAAERQLGSVL